MADFQKQLPFQNFVGDKTVGKSGTQCFGGFQRGWCEASETSFKPPLSADEVDAQRKKAIKVKVIRVP